MKTVKELLSPLLCCFGVDDEGHTASNLRALQKPTSVLSVALPASTVPHSLGHSGSVSADADALRQIFRSSSSVRGYRTASRTTDSSMPRQSSFNADYKLETKESSRRKQPSRIEQLGYHIKQKLSESRLSKSSSRAHMASEDAAYALPSQRRMLAPLGVEDATAALSQRSTGLLELLMSRSGSEGGYDSDARSIQTAMLKSSDGTIRLSPQRAAALLQSSPEPAVSREDLPKDEETPWTAGETRSEFSTSAPKSPPSPPRDSLTKVLLAERDESPTKVLLKLNDAVTNGTIKIPKTPSNTETLTATHRGSKDSRASNGSPCRSEARLQHNSTELHDILKKLNNTVAADKRDNLLSIMGENPRDSLVSNLDPGLIDFISKYGERTSIETSKSFRSKNATRMGNLNVPGMDGYISGKASIPDKEEASSKDVASMTGSDQSVHLYNMRISQRLASHSFNATNSRPNTSHTTTQHSHKSSVDARPITSQTASSGRLPGAIAIEHNRLPSDPKTRRLFENDENLGRPSSSWRSMTSGNMSGSKRPKSNPSHGETSSFYWSDGETRHGESLKPRKISNPNSIAVGGRSESVNLLVGSPSSTMSQISNAEENAWFSRKPSQQRRSSEDQGQDDDIPKRDRSVSMPSRALPESKGIPYALGKRPERSVGANETLSVITLDQIADNRREKLTEISTQAVHDARNERMSEIEPRKLGVPIRVGREGGSRRLSFWSRSRQNSNTSEIPPEAEHCDSETGSLSRQHSISIGPLQESTTDMWRRTLKRAIQDPEEESLGGFLTAPRFDREGRRRSTRSSISTIGLDKAETERDATLPTQPSNIAQLRPQESLGVKSHLEVCFQRPAPLPAVSPRPSITIIPRRPDATMVVDVGKRKKSLRDIGRRFASSGEIGRGSGASTPLRDLLGAWGRFPSHTRSERCGATGPQDGVIAQDFAAADPATTTPSSLPLWSRSTSALGFHSPGSWRVLSFGRKSRIDKAKSRSMPFSSTMNQSLESRAKKNRKGLVGRWKRIYRSSSSDLKAYVDNYGHRSSISAGASVEYPELEIIPGLGRFDDRDFSAWRSDTEGTDDRHHHEEGSQSPNSLQQFQSPLSTLPWTQVYNDCVGSLSALRSDGDIRSMSGDEETSQGLHEKNALHVMKGPELRNSTASFGVQLGKELEAVTEGLMRKVAKTGVDEANTKQD
ncbi:hypothetical protein LTR10_011503 [Elasticomyces elasticus]|uniref:Uncharacterized protein n=1 Tax=Exophiala sideris TaxID=1016849 RepID=A0ABR0JDB3_9EURO|nr:hypothetical protein LTR10_011503 [Elasticomyces elasticus]KAK5032040.1 hypothetical protein LTS07_004662 [Exophiala sideris]KAK5040968.1 hypothetical protein LTR13_003270 [Exophiala sideris]KAK5061698.1 hypothetical protein LTR69_004880 [Exophiala sideris]KAK5184398.1 hypothetical protein LTR44_003071 [Eurotiomycetes sp. CCFEE 6388]